MSLFGPDGRPIGTRRVRVNGDSLEYEDAAGVRRVTWQDQLMNMARRQRDGGSLDQIIDEFGLIGEARNPFLLQRALDKGREMLEAAIAKGEQPEETASVERALYLPGEDDDGD